MIHLLSWFDNNVDEGEEGGEDVEFCAQSTILLSL